MVIKSLNYLIILMLTNEEIWLGVDVYLHCLVYWFITIYFNFCSLNNCELITVPVLKV